MYEPLQERLRVHLHVCVEPLYRGFVPSCMQPGRRVREMQAANSHLEPFVSVQDLEQRGFPLLYMLGVYIAEDTLLYQKVVVHAPAWSSVVPPRLITMALRPFG